MLWCEYPDDPDHEAPFQFARPAMAGSDVQRSRRTRASSPVVSRRASLLSGSPGASVRGSAEVGHRYIRTGGLELAPRRTRKVASYVRDLSSLGSPPAL